MRESDLVAVGITEPLVLSNEIVKMRRAITPMAEDEDGGLDGDVFEKRFELAVAFCPKAVFDALKRDGQRAQPE